MVRDGAARGRRPVLRRAGDAELWRRLGAHPADRQRGPARTRSRERSSVRRRTWTPPWSRSSGRAGARVRRFQAAVQGSFAHRRKTLANSLELAGLATRAESRGGARGDRPPAPASVPRRSTRRSSFGSPSGSPRCDPRCRPGEDQPRTGRRRSRPDGFHEVATVMQRIDLLDRLSLEPDESFSVRGFADDTLVSLALERLAAAAGVEPSWRVRIEKRIPVAAGLGGGSADAAAALVLANQTLTDRWTRRSRRARRGRWLRCPLFSPARAEARRGGWRAAAAARSTPGLLACRRHAPSAFRSRRPRRSTAVSTSSGAAPASRLVASPSSMRSSAAGVRATLRLSRPTTWPRRPGAAKSQRSSAPQAPSRADVSGAGPAVYGVFSHRAQARAAARGIARRARSWVTVPVW